MYQLYDFTIADCILSPSTHSMKITICNETPQFICANCQKTGCSSSASVLSSACFHCQLFHCSSCLAQSSSIPQPIPAFLSHLPSCHFYWFQARNPQVPSFSVMHFFEDESESLHPFIQALLAMKDCIHCKGLKPFLFAYVPASLQNHEGIHWLLSVLPSEKTIVIPYDRSVPDLLK